MLLPPVIYNGSSWELVYDGSPRGIWRAKGPPTFGVEPLSEVEYETIALVADGVGDRGLVGVGGWWVWVGQEGGRGGGCGWESSLAGRGTNR